MKISKINGKQEINCSSIFNIVEKSRYNFRRKYNIRITEVQEQLTEVLTKAGNLEKLKTRLQVDLDRVSNEFDQVMKKFNENHFDTKENIVVFLATQTC